MRENLDRGQPTRPAARLIEALIGCERAEKEKLLAVKNNPEALRGVLDSYTRLLGGQLKGLRGQFEDAGLKDFDSKLNPRTKKVLNSDQNNNTRSNW